MGSSLTNSFTISSDGSTKTGATITASADNDLQHVTHAVVKDELYIFGGRWTADNSIKRRVKII